MGGVKTQGTVRNRHHLESSLYFQIFRPPFLRQLLKKRSNEWQSGELESFLDKDKVLRVNKEITRILHLTEEISNSPGGGFYRKVY